MGLVRTFFVTLLLVTMVFVSSVNAQKATRLSCVDFTGYPDNTQFASTFVLDGLEFESLSGANPFVNYSGSGVGLQFEDTGLAITLPSAATDIRLEIGSWASELEIFVLDNSGNIQDQVVLSGDNQLHNVQFTGSDLVRLEMHGGDNEALLAIVCTDADIPPSQDCVRFEDQTPGNVFHAGDSFIASGVETLVGEFVWSNGNMTADGFAEIQVDGNAGSAGNEIMVNNVTLNFSLSTPATYMTLRFGEYGGNVNLTINGDFANVEDFAELDGVQVGGVNVVVINGSGGDTGALLLTGLMLEVSVGGQELWVDDICFGVCGTEY